MRKRRIKYYVYGKGQSRKKEKLSRRDEVKPPAKGRDLQYNKYDVNRSNRNRVRNMDLEGRYKEGGRVV